MIKEAEARTDNKESSSLFSQGTMVSPPWNMAHGLLPEVQLSAKCRLDSIVESETQKFGSDSGLQF
jgi:hypothetical protein